MKLATFFMLVISPVAHGQGSVIPGVGKSNASLSVNITRSATESYSGSLIDSTEINGTYIASINGPEILDGAGQPLLHFEGYVTGRRYVVRDEGNFMRFIASANIDMSHQRVAALSSDVVEYVGGATVEFAFEITGAPMTMSLGWDDKAAIGQTFEPEVTISQVGSPVMVYEFPAPPGESNPGKSRTMMLDPGHYEVSIFMPVSAIVSSSRRQDLALELTVGEEPDDVPLPPPGDFTHPDVFTGRDGDGILQVLGPQIVAETPLGGGTTELRVTTSVENLRAAPWPEVRLDVATTLEGEPDLEVVSLPPVFALAANGTLAVPGEAVLRVADADLPAVRASLLDGSRFRLAGLQQPVFAYPVQPLTPRDFEQGPPASPAIDDDLTFPYAPTIGSGSIWLEWEPFHKEPPLVVIGERMGINPPTIARIQGRDRQLPVLVKDVERAGTDFQVILFDPDDPSRLGRRISIPEVMKEGQVVNELSFEGHPEGLGVTEDPESHNTSNGLSLAGLFPAPVPFHFNRFEVSPGVEVSGSFGFRPEDLVVNLEMNNFQIEALEVTARYQADCNLLLETREGADNSAEPIAGREGTLLDLPLLEVNLSNGFSFSPRLVLEAGALVSAPTSLSIPVTAGLDLMVMAGVRDGQPVYDSDFTPIPLQVSEPGLYEALGATAEAYLDCEIKALFGVAGGTFQSGPTLGARASADFTIAPLADPWWTADAGLSTFAGVEFNLAGILTLVDAEQTLQSWPLSPSFPLEADGPLVPPLAARSFDPQPGFQPIGNPRTRWARSLQPDADGVVQGRTTAAVLADGDLLAGNSSLIARYSPEGELRWAMDTNSQLLTGSVVAEPDGGFTALSSQRNVIRLARFDAAGAVLWSHAISGGGGVSWFETRKVVRRETGGGATEYFVLGQAIGSSAGGFHPSLVKIDANGDVLWSKIYPVPPLASEGINSNAAGLCVTASGDILVAGDTTADLAAAGVLGNINRNGLVFKVDGDTGEVLWSTLIAEADGCTYSAVSEGPDGSVYVGGNSPQGVTSENPSMLLVKLKPDGSLLDSVLIGCAESSDAVPHGGETVFDIIRDMAWADGQLWVCGQIGLFNAGNVGGVGTGASGFTAMISEKLDVSRFAIHAGPASDSFDDLEVTPDGLFVAGYSGSFHPWPFGASEEGQSKPGSLFTVMLPWEGRVRFHDASAGKQQPTEALFPDSGSYFVTPRVRATSQFTAETNQGLFAGLSQDNLTAFGSDSRLIVAEGYTANESSFALAPVFFEPEEYKSLEAIPESLITDLDSYLEWWQLERGEDGDGDGLTTEMEFFLGTSGSRADFGVIEFDYLTDQVTGDPFVRFTLPRSQLAAPAVPVVGSAFDLLGFNPRADVSVSQEPLDAGRDRLILELPAPEPAEFFRLEFPE